MKKFVDDAKRETDEAAPLRTLDELETLARAEVEMAQHQGDVFERELEIARLDHALIIEGETTGRAAWRYEAPDEDDVRKAAKAFRDTKPVEPWIDFDY